MLRCMRSINYSECHRSTSNTSTTDERTLSGPSNDSGKFLTHISLLLFKTNSKLWPTAESTLRLARLILHYIAQWFHGSMAQRNGGAMTHLMHIKFAKMECSILLMHKTQIGKKRAAQMISSFYYRFLSAAKLWEISLSFGVQN